MWRCSINQDHLYYGAAVIQIAEDASFTAINDLKKNRKSVRCAYLVNDGIGVYLKYRSKPDRTRTWIAKKTNEYVFVFDREALGQLKWMKEKTEAVFLALICVKDSHICCISLAALVNLFGRRKEDTGAVQSQYTLVVALPPGRSFRVYVTQAGRRNVRLGAPILVARTDFPKVLFQ